jgi:hypothetical protein
MSKEAEGGDLGIRMAGVFLPTIVTANLAAVWLPKPLALAGSIFVWAIAVYWIPSKPRLKLRSWLIVVSVLTLFSFLLAVFVANAF